MFSDEDVGEGSSKERGLRTLRGLKVNNQRNLWQSVSCGKWRIAAIPETKSNLFILAWTNKRSESLKRQTSFPTILMVLCMFVFLGLLYMIYIYMSNYIYTHIIYILYTYYIHIIYILYTYKMFLIKSGTPRITDFQHKPTSLSRFRGPKCLNLPCR